MSNKKDSNDPATTSSAWDEMFDKWLMVETLMGGTPSMREAATLYLPKHSEESDKDYDIRLNKSILFNMTELTLDAWVGRPFSDPVKLNEDVPEQIIELADDIDLQGNNLTVFCRTWFKESLSKAFAHILIDFPTMSEEDKIGRTLADDNEEGRRPYWLLIKPENVIAAHSQNINGQEILTHVRIREVIIEQDGFTEIEKERIRILEPGFFQVLEKRKTKKKDEWVVIEQGETGLPIIPLVSFYADRTGLMQGKPPIEDLAYLNVRHFQAVSDMINVLTVAQFPMLAVSGATDQSGDAMRIGPKQLLGTSDPNGKFYYVEHTGKAIASGRQEIMDLEEQMSAYGAEFLAKRPGSPTATARALDSSESISPLQDHVLRFIDSVNMALKITAMWLRIDESGTVDIATDFGPEKPEDIDLRSINEARRNRDISRETYLKELSRRGILSDDFDMSKNLSALKSEPDIISPFATGANIATGEKRQTSDQLGRPQGDTPDGGDSA